MTNILKKPEDLAIRLILYSGASCQINNWFGIFKQPVMELENFKQFEGSSKKQQATPQTGSGTGSEFSFPLKI